MIKPWRIFATSTNCQSKQLDSYSSRGDAESDAQKYRRILGTLYTVRVIWVADDSGH